MNSPSPTNRTVRQLRQQALDALIALHNAEPAIVHELAGMIERAALVHTALMPYARCPECEVKRSTAALLRSVATLREIVTVPAAAPDA